VSLTESIDSILIHHPSTNTVSPQPAVLFIYFLLYLSSKQPFGTLCVGLLELWDWNAGRFIWVADGETDPFHYYVLCGRGDEMVGSAPLPGIFLLCVVRMNFLRLYCVVCRRYLDRDMGFDLTWKISNLMYVRAITCLESISSPRAENGKRET
jgi:hypothetical protein